MLRPHVSRGWHTACCVVPCSSPCAWVAPCLEGSILGNPGDQLLQGQTFVCWSASTWQGSLLSQTVALAAWQPMAHLELCRAEVPVIFGVGLLQAQGNEVKAQPRETSSISGITADAVTEMQRNFFQAPTCTKRAISLSVTSPSLMPAAGEECTCCRHKSDLSAMPAAQGTNNLHI